MDSNTYQVKVHLDGLTIATLTAELGRLVGSRVQRIYHPQPSVITLELWAGQEQIVLIETEENPRIQVTRARLANPPQPSAFCMLLRKYLRNGIIVEVSQPDLERILDLRIRHGEDYTLRTELLGKQANVILLHKERILGALKLEVGQRSFRPGEIYQGPPSQAKLDPRTMTQEEFLEHLEGSEAVAHALLQVVGGIGPRLAKEIALRAGLDPAHPVSMLTTEQRLALWDATRQLWANVLHHPSPCVYFDGDKPVDVAPLPLKLYEHLRCKSYPTLSQALDEFCSPQERSVAHKKRELQELVSQQITKKRIALERVTQDLTKAKDYERFKREGELLFAHLAELQKGLNEIELEDFDGTRKTIKLDPALTPVENAQQKFERYKKLKRAQEKLAKRLEELRQELEYLESVEISLEHATSDAELVEIQEDLRAEGYLPRERSRPESSQALGPREFLIRGYRVLVGRSSRQNDELVRQASREDYWLHARERPGAHVIVKNPTQREIPREVLEQAAQLAAYYSKGRDAKKVPVSYTRVKYLRKGGRPGLVFVTQEEGTLLVTPKGEV
ncbi:MAG: NFACT family protein [Candidatus Bipolaricaulota bacterium]|nr:NFACT family protein [Candidatus Bipolaricaulota bacterium]MDW8031331.1 NFACT family protein [Candidatus Bipolaricaulota bacterium]